VADDFHCAAFSRFMGGPIGRFLIRHFNFFVNSFMRVVFGDKRRLMAAAHAHYRRILSSTPRLGNLWAGMANL
jgi:haloalkane dehalogenase